MAVNPYARENRQQLFADILRNAAGLPENALTLGTGLVAQAGTGLGTLAGMARQKLKGEKIDFDAASDTIGENAERFTFMPRSKGGQEFARGLGTVMEPIDRGMQAVGQKAADVTGSPAVGAAVYTGLNVLDPEMLAPAAAKIAALRGAQSVARRGAETAVPMGEALAGVPIGQRGAYTLEDLNAVEGDFGFRSPTLEAFGKLKKQEQRVPGRQMRQALVRSGAKPDELRWMGLDRILDTDEVLSAADVRLLAERNAPQMGFETKGGRPEPVVMPPEAKDVPRWQNPYAGKQTLREAMDEDGSLEDQVNEWVSNRVYEDSDLEYPETYTVYRGSGRYRDEIETFDNERDAERYIEQLKDDAVESETEYYLENIEEHFDEETLAEMDDNARQAWAERAAHDSVNDGDEYSVESVTDYDSEPLNYDSLRDYWEEQAHENASDFGDYAPSAEQQRREERRWYQQQGVDPDTLSWLSQRPSKPVPAYGDYTIGGTRSEGRDVLGGAGQNYGVTLANVLREGRFGRGTDPQAELAALDEMSQQGIAGPEGAIDPNRKLDPKLAARERERIQQREALPDIGQAREPFTQRGTTHYGENMLHVRETDRPAPEWGSVQTDAYGNPNPMRMIEEAQSDPYQRGRKIGFLDPENAQQLRLDTEARNAAFQNEALSGVTTALTEPAFDDYIQQIRNLPPSDRAPGEQHVINLLEQFQATDPTNFEARQQAAYELFNELYYRAPSASPLESRAVEIRDALGNLSRETESPFNKMVPEGPFMETEQYTKLALIDAVRRAVQQGQQYLAFSPGETHARRYGSESVQWATDPDNPVVRILTAKEYGNEGRGPIDERVRQLQANPTGFEDDEIARINLEDPEAAQRMKEVVDRRLSYGMHEYAKPDEQKMKRANMLLQKMGKEGSGDYTPREFGFKDVYDRRMMKALAEVLRAAGSKAEIRDIVGQFGRPTFETLNPDGTKDYTVATSKDEFDRLMAEANTEGSGVTYIPPRQKAIEIDPALAQAAKRGFMLPY
jgi:hypothetical protein